jgi:hypothetical protein
MKHKAYFAGKLNGKSCANGESSRLFKISQWGCTDTPWQYTK